jgi:predicted RNase H-like HicB family nuclease
MAFQAQDYEVRIWWSPEDQLYLAQCTEMTGIMAHGETRAEAAQNIQDALDHALACYAEDGVAPPAPQQHSAAQAA